MYLGIDVGGTKTLVGVLNEHGVITEKVKFPTPKDYAQFLADLRRTVEGFKARDFQAAAVGIPAVTIDRVHGRGINFGNLPWRDKDIAADIEAFVYCPVLIENDAKLGGLSEYMLVQGRYQRVLYLAIGTGIGIALVVDGKIDTSLGDGGGRTLLLEHQGRLTAWEDFASGRAIVERYHQKAKDITDEATWKRIAFDLSRGFIELLALTQPQIVIIGGSVGTYFERYGTFLQAELEKHATPLLPIPPIVQAQRPEEAVVYGGYDLIKQSFAHASATH